MDQETTLLNRMSSLTRNKVIIKFVNIPCRFTRTTGKKEHAVLFFLLSLISSPNQTLGNIDTGERSRIECREVFVFVSIVLESSREFPLNKKQ